MSRVISNVGLKSDLFVGAGSGSGGLPSTSAPLTADVLRTTLNFVSDLQSQSI
ncbi:MAG: hypothetical protein ACI915_005001 [Gammaproteobacteria bacterium]|jgi:hypothetical protein